MMRTKLKYLVFCWLLSATLVAQRGLDGGSGGDSSKGSSKPTLEHSNDTIVDLHDRIWSWKMIDDYTYMDTVIVDTLLSGFHNYDPIFKESFSNIYLGNKGSAYTSNLLSFKSDFNEFIFLNALQMHFVQPKDLQFFNTKVPYTNLAFKNSPPNSRSEENFTGFFTQNVNKDLNFALRYDLVSSIGSYEASQTDNRSFNLYSSYHSARYSMHAGLIYNSIDHYESGGLDNDNHEYITDPDTYDFGDAEDIPIKYWTATNEITNFQLFYNHSLGIGKIKLNKSLVSDTLVSESKAIEEEVELPVSTVYHTVHMGTYSRVFGIEDLDDYADDDGTIPLFDNIYADTLQTCDSTNYSFINNTFQIKFNEEANSLLRFGLRAFISNQVKHYNYQIEPIVIDDGDDDSIVYRSADTTLVTTYIGGQVFKNLGDNLWWNAGGKIYVQGYKVGDVDLQGNINSLYRVFKDTAGIYGRGRILLKRADFLQENYYSNHFKWDNSFSQEKLVNIEVGLNIPTRRIKLSWENKVYTDYIYWNEDALPDQSSEVINAFQLTLQKHFLLGAFHSNFKLAYQNTSDEEIYPLPDFTGYISNYFDFSLAKKVLTIQVGMDVRYHTAYYTPAYMPATGQYHLQGDDKVKVGNYPFMDIFANVHLKRARAFVKLDHINQTLLDRNYFLTKSYPYAPMRIKWGISWNFYN